MTDVSSVYRKELDQEIISVLAARKRLSLDAAMDIYYRSRLARQIAEGSHGIEYLSANYLVEDLIENEPDLFV